MKEHAIELPVEPQAALAAVSEAAEAWGGELRREGGTRRLHLPVVTGLRRGVASGSVTVEPAGRDGSRVVFREEERVDSVHTPAVVILLLAAAGAALTVIWPIFPQLLPIAPFGAILALGGWFLVVSRLRSSGPEEFLKTVEELARLGPEEGTEEDENRE